MLRARLPKPPWQVARKNSDVIRQDTPSWPPAPAGDGRTPRWWVSVQRRANRVRTTSSATPRPDDGDPCVPMTHRFHPQFGREDAAGQGPVRWTWEAWAGDRLGHRRWDEPSRDRPGSTIRPAWCPHRGSSPAAALGSSAAQRGRSCPRRVGPLRGLRGHSMSRHARTGPSATPHTVALTWAKSPARRPGSRTAT